MMKARPVGLLLSEATNSVCVRKRCHHCTGKVFHVSGPSLEGAVCTAVATVHICVFCDVPEVYGDD
jgi:hypothetical protein